MVTSSGHQESGLAAAHLALALSTTRMLVGVDGVYRDTAIDWSRITGARRF